MTPRSLAPASVRDSSRSCGPATAELTILARCWTSHSSEVTIWKDLPLAEAACVPPKRARDEKPRCRRDALQFAMRDDRGRHRGAMRMRRREPVDRIEIAEESSR